MTRILPPPTELTQAYWEGCRTGELLLQQCRTCGQHQFYPRNICSHCSATDLHWSRSSGRGTVASFTVVRRGLSRAYASPYIVALIDLQEGPRMMSNIVGAEPEEISIGAAVTVEFEGWSEDVSMPVFRLDKDGGQE